MKKVVTEKATLNNGKISCTIYGEITGVDCGCLKEEKKCSGCAIFNSIQSLKEEIKSEKDVLFN